MDNISTHRVDLPATPELLPIDITIQGIKFQFHSRYAPGMHVVLSEGEAAAFNRLLSENLRNNFANKIKARKEELGLDPDDGLDEDSLESLRGEFADYEMAYVFSTSSAPRAAVDATTALATKLAREALATHLRRQGKALKDFSEEQIDEKISIALERNPAFREEAIRRIEAARGVAEATFDF